ncbi:hypothetical protein ABW21_db0201123 [Orbilia brochopaga]|nr:hypothetical protein ABW21_db0201123 [Drechslerella brochopaga]
MAASGIPKDGEKAAKLRLHRFKHDISEFLEQPYPGIDIFLQDDSYDKICLHLTPQGGPLCGLRLHFTIHLSELWPQMPPRFECNPSSLLHPNNTLGFVCGDVLNTSISTGGYLAAYTLRALCIQLLSVFSETTIITSGFVGDVVFDYGGHILTSYADLDYLRREHDGYDQTVMGMFDLSNPAADIRSSGWPLFGYGLRHLGRRTEVEYINVNHVFGESTTDCEPGSWAGWNSGYELPQREIEITKLVLEDGDNTDMGTMARVRYRNPLWLRALQDTRAWAGCSHCGCNQPGGLPIVQEHLVKPLKDALAEIDAAVTGISEAGKGTCASTDGPQETLRGGLKKCLVGGSPILELPADVLLLIAEYLPTESIRIFSVVHPQFEAVVKQYHIIRSRELQCVVFCTGLNAPALLESSVKTILGIAVRIFPGPKTICSSFDYLSLEAFEEYGMDKGTNYDVHKFYLPLVFSDAHFRRAHPVIWQCINWIAATIDNQKDAMVLSTGLPSFRTFPTEPNLSNVKILYKFISDIVTTLFKAYSLMVEEFSKDRFGGHQPRSRAKRGALERAMMSYFQLFHLLVKLASLTPAIRTDALAAIAVFRDDQENRTVEHVPNLMHLLTQLAVVNATSNDTQEEDRVYPDCISWGQAAGLIIQEAAVRFARSVEMWVISIEVDEGQHRPFHVFKNWRGLARSYMLHVFFTRFIVDRHRRSGNLTCELDREFGFPPPEAVGALATEIDRIFAIDSWQGVFRYVGYEEGAGWDDEKVCQVLNESLVESRRRGYERGSLDEVPLV